MKEHSWTILGLIMSGIFGLLGMIFLILKEKACVLISDIILKLKKKGRNMMRLAWVKMNVVFSLDVQ